MIVLKTAVPALVLIVPAIIETTSFTVRVWDCSVHVTDGIYLLAVSTDPQRGVGIVGMRTIGPREGVLTDDEKNIDCNRFNSS